MKKIVRLTESELVRLVKRIVNESNGVSLPGYGGGMTQVGSSGSMSRGGMTTVPEDLKKKIMECLNDNVKANKVIQIMLKYPTIITLGVELMGGKFPNPIDIGNKIEKVLDELSNVGQDEINLVTTVLMCVATSSIGGGFKLPKNPFGL